MIKYLRRPGLVRSYTMATIVVGIFIVGLSFVSAYTLWSQDKDVQTVSEQFAALPDSPTGEQERPQARVDASDQLEGGNHAALIAFVQVLILIGTGVYMRVRLGNPIMAEAMVMAGNIKLVASGDLRVQPQSAMTNEYGQLHSAFGEMVEAFRNTVARIEGAAGDLKQAAAEMAHTSDEAGHAIGEVAQAISSISEGAAHQVDMVTRTQQVVAEIEGAISDASEHVDHARRQAADAESLADEGVASAAEVQVAMEAVRETSLTTAEVVRSLGEKSSDIDQIVQAITDIAAQTNLLALNAAIEAARAGEQGRGFAVVAEEVRKLAEDAQASAASIADLIKQIQAQTEEAVGAMERGVSQVEESTQTVERSRQTFYDVSSAVQTLHAGSSQIAALAENIAGGADRVRAQIEEVASVAEESSASTEQVSASTQQTSAASQQVTASAQRVEQTAVELAELAGRFKLP